MNANQQDEFNPQLYFMVLESNRLTMVNVENQSNELLSKFFVELKLRFPLPDIKVSASQECSSLEEKIYAILTTWLKKKELNNVHGQVIRDGFFFFDSEEVRQSSLTPINTLLSIFGLVATPSLKRSVVVSRIGGMERFMIPNDVDLYLESRCIATLLVFLLVFDGNV